MEIQINLPTGMASEAFRKAMAEKAAFCKAVAEGCAEQYLKQGKCSFGKSLPAKK